MKIALLFLSLLIAVSSAVPQEDGVSGKNDLLCVDDLLEVKVYQEDDLTTRARVSRDGTITFPLLGSVAVAGRSAEQAGEIIRARLAERFLVKPQVNLSVIEHARKLFTVLGQVQRAGTYKFPDREAINLIQAIGMAGGFTRMADTARVTLKRVENGREVVRSLDARKMSRDGSTPFKIQPGDMISVPERLF